MGRIIGIDLGTTNSVASYWSRRRPKAILNTNNSPLTPSMVALDQGIRYVGEDAKDRRYKGSRNVIYSVKRFIGRDYDDPHTKAALEKMSYHGRKAENGEVEIELGESFYSPIEISAMILDNLRKDAEQALGESVTHAVITVPAYFNQRQKNATREAGQLAGLKVLRIINEPTASALSFGLEENLPEPQHILVYDFGGGTFDVSVLLVSNGNFDVLNIEGDNFLGGDDFDNLIIDKMLEELEKEAGEDYSQDASIKNILKGRAEEIKIKLSREDKYRIVEAGLAKTKRNTPLNLDYTLTRAGFEKMIADKVKDSIEITKRALEKESLSPSDIDRVLLVGGSTRIPLIRERLKEMFQNKIEVDVDPMQCVALGAAIQTAIPIEWVCASCSHVNEGTEESCRSCKRPQDEIEDDAPMIVCEICGKKNRQGRLFCWSCNATIGAVIKGVADDNQQDSEDTVIRIGDITSKNLGVEVETKDLDDKKSSLAVIIKEGTPYPTHKNLRKELYTSIAGQDWFRVPIYEVEQLEMSSDEWEHVGVVVNDKIPAGTPAETPVIIEMGIDADGILTVLSYLKKMKAETLVSKEFTFGSGETLKSGVEASLLDNLGFDRFRIFVCIEEPDIKKHLTVDHVREGKKIIAEIDEIIESKDVLRAKPMSERAKLFIDGFPPPANDLFWSIFLSNQDEISASERSEMNRLKLQMEKEAAHEDYDQANEYLSQIRMLHGKLFAKLPSNLLKDWRG